MRLHRAILLRPVAGVASCEGLNLQPYPQCRSCGCCVGVGRACQSHQINHGDPTQRCIGIADAWAKFRRCCACVQKRGELTVGSSTETNNGGGVALKPEAVLRIALLMPVPDWADYAGMIKAAAIVLAWGHVSRYAGCAFRPLWLVRFCVQGFNRGTGTILLSAGAWRELDLLARRREQLGLARPQPIAVKTLLLRGTLIGGLFPLVVLVTCLVLLVQDRLLARQEQQLTPDAERYDLVEQSLNDLVVQMDALTTRNRSIAVAMADVRSSSALLAELTQLLPAEMTLDSFQIEGSRLSIDGTVLEPNGLLTIMFLQLAIQPV